MKQFKQPTLKGIDDLSDTKYSLHNLIRAESWKEYNSTEDAKQSQINGGKAVGGKAFARIWEEDPEYLIPSCIQGGITQGNINKEQGLGIFSQSKEQLQENARKANESFWANATEEDIKAKYDKASDSMKKTIEKKGWWNPHQYKTQEQIDAGARKMKATVLQKKIDAIQLLYDNIDTNDWFDLNQAHEYLLSYRTGSLSTVRRMLYSWIESKMFFEATDNNTRFRKLQKED